MCKISVILCTYNRCKILESAIGSLIDQTFNKEMYEIIIVDNNSTDDTRKVVERYIEKNRDVRIRYFLEPNQGLSNARNRGFHEARGEYIAYIDDDAKASPQWLEAASKVIERVSPSVFGGPYFAYYITPKPKWFSDRYGSHIQGNEARQLMNNEYLDGTNMFFRKSLLEAAGGFDPDLGMQGKKIGYGEETALLMRIRESYPDEIIYYDPKIFVYHLVLPEKTKLRWIIKNRFISGMYSYNIFQSGNQVSVEKYKLVYRVALNGYRFLKDVLSGVLKRDRTRYPYIENYIYEHSCEYISEMGSVYKQLKYVKGR